MYLVYFLFILFFFFKQKTAYEMRISDWSSDLCSSDLPFAHLPIRAQDKFSLMKLESKIPDGPLAEKWSKHKFNMKLVNPANKRKYEVIVVGTGLAGASAAASLAELGYNVKAFCFQDSARRAHSIAAQGGINAAKNYSNDGDSVYRLFSDTVKVGEYPERERSERQGG